MSYPEFQVIKGSCEHITADKAPPPLTPVVSPGASVPAVSVTLPTTAPSPSAPTTASLPSVSSSNVDPLSGLPLELSRQYARFSYLDIQKSPVSFLKVSVSPSVLAIG